MTTHAVGAVLAIFLLLLMVSWLVRTLSVLVWLTIVLAVVILVTRAIWRKL